MPTAILVASNLVQFSPGTNHYRCSDGKWLLVTVLPATLKMVFYVPAAVFLSDEHASVLDADGDPANGMTPLSTPDVDTHEAALAELGYELIGEEG